MKRSKLLSIISANSGVSRMKCDAVLEATVDAITDALSRGDEIKIQNFMTIKVGKRPERSARNPMSGEIVIFPEVKTVKCVISKALKDAVNGRYEV